MPRGHHEVPEKGPRAVPAGFDYDADKQWRTKPLTPANLLVNDIRLEQWRPDRGPLLEVNERSISSLVPETAALTPSASFVRASEAALNPIEQQRFTNLEEDFGWIRYLRLQQYQRDPHDSEESAKVRWVHCSSKFPEYLSGFLWALSDEPGSISVSVRRLDHVLQRQTRFSKHGKYFAPFCEVLSESEEDQYPMLISCPFLDWTINGPTPPLRFQIDRREGYESSRGSAHALRSVLQHYYRLEDTADREKAQVFSKHKPWSTDRDLDLKVRQWYGHHPTGLNVDELWILAVDAEHIVTFSGNQTWKARWPPLQLTSRISDVSFRSIRNAYFGSDNDDKKDYTSITHAIASLSGAVGMLHRNFWPDMVLPMVDRYAGLLGHLQYRLHRSPSTKLVMDLIACQDELNIVIQITQQQVETLAGMQTMLDVDRPAKTDMDPPITPRPTSRHQIPATYGDFNYPAASKYRAVYRQIGSSSLTDPMAQMLDNLQRELADLQDLRDNANALVNRTIQLVNIRLEDHGKAIMVFTLVTIVFLPLNFVSSFFGMNVSDIRNLEQGQWLFWLVAMCVTIAVVAISAFLAFSGSTVYERLVLWRDRTHQDQRLSTMSVLKQAARNADMNHFRTFGTDRTRYGGGNK